MASFFLHVIGLIFSGLVAITSLILVIALWSKKGVRITFIIVGIVSAYSTISIFSSGLNKASNKVGQVKGEIRQSIVNSVKENQLYYDTLTTPQMRELIQLSNLDVKNIKPTNFLKFDGEFDWDRAPILYPYSINTIDNFRTGYIAKEDTISGGLYSTNQQVHLIRNIKKLAYDSQFILLETSNMEETISEFVFIDSKSGNQQTFSSWKKLKRFANKRRFNFYGKKQLTSIKEVYNTYWLNPLQ